MLKRNLLMLLAFLPIASSCSYSGHMTLREENGPGGVQYRAGIVPYKNDSSAASRRDDAVRKIAKYCGSDGYTITKEGPSPYAADSSEIRFTCRQAAAASPAAAAPPA
jgi:hypothetical protein